MPYRSLLEWLGRSRFRPIVVASYPRSGTHLLIDSLRLNFDACRSWKYPLERIDRLYLNLANLAWRKDKLAAAAAIRILSRAPRPLIKTHAWPDFSQDVSDRDDLGPIYPAFSAWLQEHAALLYVYRDGRETLASRHLMVQQGIRPSARVPFGEFIRQAPLGMSRARAWATHVRKWMSLPGVHSVKMEKLRSDPTTTLDGIADRIGLSRPTGKVRLPELHETTLVARLARLLARRPPSTAIRTATRPVAWRSALSMADRKFFLDETGDLLVRLGYERSDDWIDPGNDARQRSRTPQFS